jgi:hypothetical protein
MYECGTCGYTTKRSFNFDLHNNRKIPCKPKAAIISKSFEQNDSSDIELISGVIITPEFFEPNGSFGHTCNNCNKTFTLKQVLVKHQKSCSGPPTNPLECHICLKLFNTSAAKCQHNRKVKCKRPDLNPKPETTQVEINRLRKENAEMAENNESLTKQNDMKDEAIKMKNEEIVNLIELNAVARKKLKSKQEPKPKSKRTFVTAITRLEIASSQTWCCSICTNSLPAYFEIDHTIPLWNDGMGIRENVTAV